MIVYVEIEGEKYPFKFGIREITSALSMAGEDTLNTDALLRNPDALFHCFELGSKKGARRTDSELTLSAMQIEDAIDDDFDLLEDLIKALMKCMPKEDDPKKKAVKKTK